MEVMPESLTVTLSCLGRDEDDAKSMGGKMDCPEESRLTFADSKRFNTLFLCSGVIFTQSCVGTARLL